MLAFLYCLYLEISKIEKSVTSIFKASWQIWIGIEIGLTLNYIKVAQKCKYCQLCVSVGKLKYKSTLQGMELPTLDWTVGSVSFPFTITYLPKINVWLRKKSHYRLMYLHLQLAEPSQLRLLEWLQFLYWRTGTVQKQILYPFLQLPLLFLFTPQTRIAIVQSEK